MGVRCYVGCETHLKGEEIGGVVFADTAGVVDPRGVARACCWVVGGVDNGYNTICFFRCKLKLHLTQGLFRTSCSVHFVAVYSAICKGKFAVFVRAAVSSQISTFINT